MSPLISAILENKEDRGKKTLARMAENSTINTPPWSG